MSVFNPARPLSTAASGRLGSCCETAAMRHERKFIERRKCVIRAGCLRSRPKLQESVVANPDRPRAIRVTMKGAVGAVRLTPP